MSILTKVVAAGPIIFAAFALQAQNSRSLGPRDGRGLAPTDTGRVKVGAVAPDFRLQSFDRGQIALSDFRGRKTVVLVFYRGHW